MTDPRPHPARFLRPSLAAAALLGLLATPAAASEQPPAVSNGGTLQTTRGDRAVALPLRHTDVKAEVSAMVTAVEVTQEFQNPYGQPIEAIYVFPLPHRAAVHQMTITIGQREIRGVVQKRAQARRTYLRARAQGRTAALLDQERPNIFTQSIANIMPRDRIRVRILYVEELAPRGGVYEFAFPMVVGPRYVGGGEPLGGRDAGAGWARDTTHIPDASRITPRLLARGLRPGHDIALQLAIDGGRAVRELQVVTHRARVATAGARTRVTLDPGDAIPNKDFVVRYRLAGEQPEVALLAQRGTQGGHFLLTIQPKAQMTARDISPREYVFVVDNSGSMSGFPLQQARALVQRLLGAARPTDTLRVIKFAGVPDQLSPRALPATRGNVRTAVRYVQSMQGGGGTEFLPALQLALRAPKDPARARIVLFITDGYIGYEAEVLRFLRQHRGSASLFALGVGSAVNRFLIDGMARLGLGEPFYLLNAEREREVADRLVATLSRPALTAIRVDWGGLALEEVSPAAPPDLFGERPVVLTGRFTRGGSGTVTVRGSLAGRPFTQSVAVTLPDAPGTQHRAIATLWARRQITELTDIEAVTPERQPETEARITRLALAYGLVSRYTSFVAVDRLVRNPGGNGLSVPVPLPLPDGVTSRAAPRQAFISAAPAAGGGGPDNDRDSIPDSCDQCPNEPETYNGYADEDGCPDMGRVIVHSARIEVLDKIYFAPGSAAIKPVAFPILDAIAATLQGNPQIKRVELQGHQDDREAGARRGADLALARARAVQRYLVAKGVSPERLVVKNYGAKRPMDQRKSREARERNRRVEFFILERES